MAHGQVSGRLGGSASTVGFCLFLLAAAFFLWTEHRAHAFGALPYAILLLCPLIHLFMHRGHGHHGTSSGRKDGPTDAHRHGDAS